MSAPVAAAAALSVIASECPLEPRGRLRGNPGAACHRGAVAVMVRPMKRRTGTRWFARALWFLLAGGAILAVSAYLAASTWVKHFLQSDACREMLERRIGGAAHARCELGPVTWAGWNAYSAGATLQAEGGAGWRWIEVDGLQASLDLSGLRRGVWLVPEIGLDWLRVSMRGGQTQTGSKPAPPPSETDREMRDRGAPVWVRRWLPTRAEVGEVDVRRFDLKPLAQGGGVTVEGVHIKARPAAEQGVWRMNGNEGRVLVPGVAEPFRLGSAAARVDPKSFVLNDASARWLGDSEVTARGEVAFAAHQGWIMSGRVAGLDLRHILSKAWNPKLGGVAEGDYEVSGHPGAEVLRRGRIRVKNGVVQALPLLERVADFTNTERFRRVVLDEAAGDVEAQGARTRVSNLALQSNGLLRVEGELTIEGGVIAGVFLVGVSPETLRWLPGSKNRVFTETNAGKVPGFVWTRVKVGGTTQAPKEDLSSRLLVAMGRAVLIDAPMEVLGTGLDGIGALVPAGKAVLDGGGEVIKGAGEAVGKGLDTLRGVIPLIPKQP